MYHGKNAAGDDHVIIRDADKVPVLPQSELNAWLRGEADRLGVPMVATNDAHYLSPEDGDAHDSYLCLAGSGKWKGDEKRIRFPGAEEFCWDYYLKDEKEMKAALPRSGWWQSACDNTQVLADTIDSEVIKLSNVIHLPRFDVPSRGDDLEYDRWLRRKHA